MRQWFIDCLAEGTAMAEECSNFRHERGILSHLYSSISLIYNPVSEILF
jgi:hypothetical protein